MVTTLARFVSYLFHPLLVPTYSFSLCMLVYPDGMKPIPPSFYSNFLILIFLITFVLPLLLMGILRTLGLIGSYHIPERKERVLPFLVITLLYVSITFMFYKQSKIHPGENFMKLMILIDLLVLVSTVITVFFKVSIHSLSVWGVIGILIPLNKIAEGQGLFLSTVIIVALAGIIMSSRLYLQAHSLREVLWGSITGLAVGLTGTLILF
jgi:hypothetical protein